MKQIYKDYFKKVITPFGLEKLLFGNVINTNKIVQILDVTENIDEFFRGDTLKNNFIELTTFI